MSEEYWAHKLPGGASRAPQSQPPGPPPTPHRPAPKFAFKLGRLVVEVYVDKKGPKR